MTLIAVAVTSFAFAAPVTSAAAANSRSRPVLFVHGYDPNLNLDPYSNPKSDCRGDFGDMTWQMRNEGWSGENVYVGFYQADTNCDVNLHWYRSYDDRDSWKNIARAFAWYVYDTYTSRGIQVDTVGYSMGGLITRGAIHGAQIGEPGFPPPLDVAGAATFGTPFGGAILSGVCIWGQCASFSFASADLAWLKSNCYPNGRNGTLWTVFSSTNDWTVRPESSSDLCTYPDRNITVDTATHSGATSYIHQRFVINLMMNGLDGTTSRMYSGLDGSKCIDVRYMATTPGTPIQTFDCNNTYAQLWTRSQKGWPTTIQALGMCLQRAGNSLAPGTKVELARCNGSPAQEWLHSTLDSTIRSRGMCLDAAGGSAANWNQLIIWTCHAAAGQRW